MATWNIVPITAENDYKLKVVQVIQAIEPHFLGMVTVWQTGTIPATRTTAKLFSSTTQSAFFNINVFGSVPTSNPRRPGEDVMSYHTYYHS
jgi:hypothetical protein